MKQIFQVIAKYLTLPDSADAVARLLPELAKASRNEPENLGYAVHQDLEDPRRFAIIERYTSEAGFAAHKDSTHFSSIAADQILPLLEERIVETSNIPTET